MQVDRDRLRGDLEANAAFGAVPVEAGRARTVLTGSDADRRAREYFRDRLREAGLSVRVDAVGNVVGRWTPPSADPGAAPVATGSHLDSVPEGGIFDGPLGVYAGLEAVRAMQEAGVEPARPVEVVSFTEEEGQRFGGGLLGSGVAAGELTVESALSVADDEGVTLGEALAGIGFRGEGRVDAADWDAFVEVHVEQADRLEAAGVPVGVVTEIVGLSRCRVEVVGEANHAGSTSMADRADALAAAGEFLLAVERAASTVPDASSTTVATVGRLDVAPNAPNVVPGRVTLSVDVRDVDHGVVGAVVDALRTSLEDIERDRPVATDLDHAWDRPPVRMSRRCRDRLVAAAEATDTGTLAVHSGAGHDAMHVASATDAAMLFAPSRDGISHSPLEWTDWDDCAAVTRVLAGGLASLATDTG